MNRFDFMVGHEAEYSYVYQDSSSSGEYVCYEEAQAEIKRLRELLSNLVEEVVCGREVWDVRGTSAYVDAKAEVDCDE